MVDFGQLAAFLGVSYTTMIALMIAQVWSMIWKGFAWWKAARKGQVFWFVIFFLVHTLGILEILYIFLFSDMKFENKTKKRRK